MPIYVVRCARCGAEREILLKRGSEMPTVVCGEPDCSPHSTMRLVPSAPAIHFKGTGWTAKGPGRRE